MPDRHQHPWPEVCLREIGEISAGGTPSRDDPSLWNGTVPWLTPGDLTKNPRTITTDGAEYITKAGLNRSAAALMPPGALLVTTRATLGARTIAGVPMATNQGFKNIVFNPALADSRFYFHLFGLLASELVRRASGTTFLEISGKEFGNIKVPRPPLFEQRKIAELLDVVDDKIQAVTLELSKLRLLRSGALRHAMSAGLGLIGSVEASRFRDIDGIAAHGWSAIRLGSLILQIEAGNSPDLEDRPAANGEWGVLKVSSVGRDGFRPAENKVALESALHHENLCVRAGDLIMTRANTADLVGLSCVVEETPSNLMLCDKTLRLVVDDRKTSAKFIDLVLETDELRTQIQIAATGTSASMKNISQASIQSLVVPYSATEMERICGLDAAHRKLISVQQAELLKLRNLKQGIMVDLLTGRVRVRRDR